MQEKSFVCAYFSPKLGLRFKAIDDGRLLVIGDTFISTDLQVSSVVPLLSNSDSSQNLLSNGQAPRDVATSGAGTHSRPPQRKRNTVDVSPRMVTLRRKRLNALLFSHDTDSTNKATSTGIEEQEVPVDQDEGAEKEIRYRSSTIAISRRLLSANTTTVQRPTSSGVLKLDLLPSTTTSSISNNGSASVDPSHFLKNGITTTSTIDSSSSSTRRRSCHGEWTRHYLQSPQLLPSSLIAAAVHRRPEVGCLVISVNGVNLTGLEKEFQLSLLRNRARPMVVEYLSASATSALLGYDATVSLAPVDLSSSPLSPSSLSKHLENTAMSGSKCEVQLHSRASVEELASSNAVDVDSLIGTQKHTLSHTLPAVALPIHRPLTSSIAVAAVESRLSALSAECLPSASATSSSPSAATAKDGSTGTGTGTSRDRDHIRDQHVKDSNKESDRKDDNKLRYSTFLSKYTHKSAAKLNKRVESVLADYLACDWVQAHLTNTGEPQSTITSLYRYIESEMSRLGLLDPKKPQGVGLPEELEDHHWKELRDHIEVFIFKKVSQFTYALGPVLSLAGGNRGGGGGGGGVALASQSTDHAPTTSSSNSGILGHAVQSSSSPSNNDNNNHTGSVSLAEGDIGEENLVGSAENHNGGGDSGVGITGDDDSGPLLSLALTKAEEGGSFALMMKLAALRFVTLEQLGLKRPEVPPPVMDSRSSSNKERKDEQREEEPQVVSIGYTTGRHQSSTTTSTTTPSHHYSSSSHSESRSSSSSGSAPSNSSSSSRSNNSKNSHKHDDLVLAAADNCTTHQHRQHQNEEEGSLSLSLSLSLSPLFVTLSSRRAALAQNPPVAPDLSPAIIDVDIPTIGIDSSTGIIEATAAAAFSSEQSWRNILSEDNDDHQRAVVEAFLSDVIESAVAGLGHSLDHKEETTTTITAGILSQPQEMGGGGFDDAVVGYHLGSQSTLTTLEEGEEEREKNNNKAMSMPEASGATVIAPLSDAAADQVGHEQKEDNMANRMVGDSSVLSICTTTASAASDTTATADIAIASAAASTTTTTTSSTATAATTGIASTSPSTATSGTCTSAATTTAAAATAATTAAATAATTAAATAAATAATAATTTAANAASDDMIDLEKREEWILAMKSLCRAMDAETPVAIVRKIASTVKLISHALDAYLHRPTDRMMSFYCTRCKCEHDLRCLAQQESTAPRGRRISTSQSMVFPPPEDSCSEAEFYLKRPGHIVCNNANHRVVVHRTSSSVSMLSKNASTCTSGRVKEEESSSYEAETASSDCAFVNVDIDHDSAAATAAAEQRQQQLSATNALSADELLPALTWVLIHANPPNIDTVLWVCTEFRHPDRLHGEEAYCLSLLSSAVEFARRATAKSLDLSSEQYNAHLMKYELTLRLLIYAKIGDITAVKRCIDKGADVNGLSPDQKDCPLTACIRYDRMQVLTLLLERPEIDLNVVISPYSGNHTLLRRTPLLLAVAAGKLDFVVALLAAGADRDVVDDQGNSPLQIVQDMLLDGDDDEVVGSSSIVPDGASNMGTTIAAGSSSEGGVQLGGAASASDSAVPTQTSTLSLTPSGKAYAAAGRSHSKNKSDGRHSRNSSIESGSALLAADTISGIVAGGDGTGTSQRSSTKGRTPPNTIGGAVGTAAAATLLDDDHQQQQYRSLVVISRALSADPRHTNALEAVRDRQDGVLLLGLIAQGVDVDELHNYSVVLHPDNKRNKPGEGASSQTLPSLYARNKMFTDRSYSQPDEDLTALMLASEMMYIAIMKQLIVLGGADVNRCNSAGETALIWCVKRWASDYSTALTFLPSPLSGATEMVGADGDGDGDARRISVATPCTTRSPYAAASKERRSAEEESPTTAGKSSFEITPLHLTVVSLLLRAGADRYARDDNGYTALDYAIQAFGEHELLSIYRSDGNSGITVSGSGDGGEAREQEQGQKEERVQEVSSTIDVAVPAATTADDKGISGKSAALNTGKTRLSYSYRSSKGKGRKTMSSTGRLMNLLLYDPSECNICQLVKHMNYEGVYALILQGADVNSLYKEDGDNDMNNYRPRQDDVVDPESDHRPRSDDAAAILSVTRTVSSSGFVPVDLNDSPSPSLVEATRNQDAEMVELLLGAQALTADTNADMIMTGDGTLYAEARRVSIDTCKSVLNARITYPLNNTMRFVGSDDTIAATIIPPATDDTIHDVPAVAPSGQVSRLPKGLVPPPLLDVNLPGAGGRTALHVATLLDNAYLVGRLLEAGANRALTSDFFEAPLDIAQENGFSDVVDVLRYNPDDTSICLAAKHGNWAVVSALLRQGVPINTRQEHINAKGIQHDLFSPLIAAVANAQSDLFARLIRLPDLDVNLKNKMSQTALMFAAARGDEPAVLSLLKLGADRYVIDQTGRDAAAWAESRDHCKISLILRMDPVLMKVHDVIRLGGDCSSLIALFKQGVEPNEKRRRSEHDSIFDLFDENDRSVLLTGRSSEPKSVVIASMMKALASMKTPSSSSSSSSSSSVSSSSTGRMSNDKSARIAGSSVTGTTGSAASLSLSSLSISDHHGQSRGKSTKSTKKSRSSSTTQIPPPVPVVVDGETPLMAACMCSRTDVLSLLLKAPNIKVNATDFERHWTALFYAAEVGSEEAVLQLLQAGANRRALDMHGHTPADVAVDNKKGAVAALILYDPCTMQAHDVCTVGDVNVLKSLLRQGCPANHRDEREGKNLQTLLMAAASASREEVVKALLEHREVMVAINDTDTLGQTALMKAARAGAMEITALLLCAGSDRNLRDSLGKNATDHATKHGYSTMFSFMGQLLMHKHI